MRPPDQVGRDLLSQWLAKADEDLAVAEHLLADESPYLAAIAFHAQQAAEKYIKAFLVRRQVEVAQGSPPALPRTWVARFGGRRWARSAFQARRP